MNEPNPIGESGSNMPSIFESKEPVQREEESKPAFDWQGTVLDPRDPFETALADIIVIYRRRKPTLMVHGNIFATFEASARSLDIPYFTVPEAILHEIQKEQARLNVMRRNNILYDPDSEEAFGAYLELVFHANLLYAWIKRYARGE